jgi:hypothetical protein
MLFRKLLFYSAFVWPFLVAFALYWEFQPFSYAFIGSLIIAAGILGMRGWWELMGRTGKTDKLMRRLRIY